MNLSSDFYSKLVENLLNNSKRWYMCRNDENI